MTWRVAWRSFAAQPVRSSVLVLGFGLGITAMAGLLGVGEVILEQSRAPALEGGGDFVVTRLGAPIESPLFVLRHVLGEPPVARHVAAAAPFAEATLYLVDPSGTTTPIEARGGIPSLERALEDAETAEIDRWTDDALDRPWVAPQPGEVLRDLDRFHAIPAAAPELEASWAEWLYFNGGTGDVRFYLTFLVGPRGEPGTRRAGVRLQLEREGATTSWIDSAEIDEAALLEQAPDLAIGASRVTLEGTRYRIDLAFRAADGDDALSGSLWIDAVPGRAMPPIEIRGAGGWVSGYVVPVTSGDLGGSVRARGVETSFDGGRAYHDHNWGFWRGVTWQWGQVSTGDLSLVWGRVRPPADVLDPEMLPAFLVALRGDAIAASARRVTIEECCDPGAPPQRVLVEARGDGIELRIDVAVEHVVRNRAAGPVGDEARALGLVQMRGPCTIEGRVGSDAVELRGTASTETFRQAEDAGPGDAPEKAVVGR